MKICLAKGSGWLVIVLLGCMMSGCSANKQLARKSSDQPVRHAILVDAGSSGSRLYVYRIAYSTTGALPEISIVGSEKEEPGVSEFENDLATGRQNILDLIAFAKTQIDPATHGKTPFYLMATAGMRLYSKEKRDRIMNEIADVIRQEGSFNFKGALTISGQYEALYAWLAVNYLDDRFDPATAREGMLEMGGASAQIAHVAETKDREHTIKRKIGGEAYSLYARSFLYLGTDEMENLVTDPACYSVNYPMENGDAGTGDCRACTEFIIEKFNALCEGLECNGPHCIFSSNSVRSVADAYFAITSFYYVFGALGLDAQINNDEVMDATCDVCMTDYQELLEKYPDYLHKYVYQYCLAGAYYRALLEKGFHFPSGETGITISNEINDTEINWTLGAVLDMELGHAPERYSPR